MSTLSTTGEFVTTGLTTEKNDRLEENDVYQYPIGIASTVVDEFQLVTKELDIEALKEVQGILTIINNKKKELVGLGNIAAGPFEPGVFPPICGLVADKGDLNDTASSNNVEIDAVEGGGIGGGTTTPAVAYAVVRGDYIRIRRYPYLEKRESPNDNSLEGEKYPILTTGNAGQGKESVYFANAKYEDPDAGTTYYAIDDEGHWNVTGFEGEEGDILGRYYQVDPVAPTNSLIRIPGELSVGLVFSPNDLYVGINSFFSGIQTGNWYRATGVGQTFFCQWDVATGQLTIPGPFGGALASGPGFLSVDAGQACAGIAASQTSIENDISSIRTGLSTFFTSANTTKIRKHTAQLELWSAIRVKTRNLEESKGTNNFPRDIEKAIPAVEVVDPLLPTNSNTSDKTGITADSTTLTADSK